MTKSDWISIGEKVLCQIDANGQVNVEGELIGFPQTTGDCWKIRSIHNDGQIVYVQQFHAMWRLKK